MGNHGGIAPTVRDLVFPYFNLIYFLLSFNRKKGVIMLDIEKIKSEIVDILIPLNPRFFTKVSYRFNNSYKSHA